MKSRGRFLPSGKEGHSSITERLKNGAVALWEVIQNLLTEDAHSRKPEVQRWGHRPLVWRQEGPAGSLSLGFGTVRLPCNKSLFSFFISLLFFYPVLSSFVRIPLPPNSYVPKRLGWFLPFLDVPFEAEK